ncbi:MAG: OTU domain-containing protein [Waddliaceae bacterium]
MVSPIFESDQLIEQENNLSLMASPKKRNGCLSSGQKVKPIDPQTAGEKRLSEGRETARVSRVAAMFHSIDDSMIQPNYFSSDPSSVKLSLAAGNAPNPTNNAVSSQPQQQAPDEELRLMNELKKDFGFVDGVKFKKFPICDDGNGKINRNDAFYVAEVFANGNCLFYSTLLHINRHWNILSEDVHRLFDNQPPKSQRDLRRKVVEWQKMHYRRDYNQDKNWIIDIKSGLKERYDRKRADLQSTLDVMKEYAPHEIKSIKNTERELKETDAILDRLRREGPNDEELNAHFDKVANTAEFGTDAEIYALSQMLQCTIVSKVNEAAPEYIKNMPPLPVNEGGAQHGHPTMFLEFIPIVDGSKRTSGHYNLIMTALIPQAEPQLESAGDDFSGSPERGIPDEEQLLADQLEEDSEEGFVLIEEEDSEEGFVLIGEEDYEEAPVSENNEAARNDPFSIDEVPAAGHVSGQLVLTKH